jgi:hypothetical protein
MNQRERRRYDNVMAAVFSLGLQKKKSPPCTVEADLLRVCRSHPLAGKAPMTSSTQAVSVSILALLCCCGAPVATTETDSEDTSALELRACRTDKLDFTQATGCQNDGSVELCVPFAAEKRIRRRFPQLIATAGAGRARCDLAKERLYFFPTPSNDPKVCVANTSGMTDAVFRDVCRLAAQPEIRRIVPTFFE